MKMKKKWKKATRFFRASIHPVTKNNRKKNKGGNKIEEKKKLEKNNLFF
jgi:hypothetical protein